MAAPRRLAGRLGTGMGLVLCAALAGCAGLRTPQPLEFVIVRHAEKASDDPRDPTLSAAGQLRARGLANSLSQAHVMAAYATGYRRTQQTAAPTAAGHGLAITTYAAGQDPSAFANSLRQRHTHGTVLVVGHSNTVPAIAAALCQCVVAPIADAQYERRLLIRFPGGKPVLVDRPVP